MLRQVVAALVAAALAEGAIAAEPTRLRCVVEDEARLSRNGQIAKNDADWFKGYEFTVDLATGAVGFVKGAPDIWRIVQTAGYMQDYELVSTQPGDTTDFLRIRTWSVPPGATIIFFRARATRAYSGTCHPID